MTHLQNLNEAISELVKTEFQKSHDEKVKIALQLEKLYHMLSEFSADKLSPEILKENV